MHLRQQPTLPCCSLTSMNCIVLKQLIFCQKNISPTKIAQAFNCKQSDSGGLVSVLKVNLNASIILTVNIDLQDQLINGQIGAIKHISKDRTNNITKIYIKFDDTKVGLKKMSTDFFAKQNSWVPIEKAERNIIISSKSGVLPVFRRPFPLMLAWACIVHKVQGLTLQQTVVNSDLLKQKQLNYDQMYVALSRVTSLRSLHLTGEIKAADIRSEPRGI